MTLICGWRTPSPMPDTVVHAMGRALRVQPAQVWGQWTVPGLSVGLLEIDEEQTPELQYAPAVCPAGRWHLWMAGEAFDFGRVMPVTDPSVSRTLEFRRELLSALLTDGIDVIRHLDGEYVVVLWDAAEQCLTLLNDRFGSLPLYWGQSSEGFAFAGGVRGVLMAPGMSPEPDLEALREAVTFGGFRLGDRTNVTSVKMVPGAAVVTVGQGPPTIRRYWRWQDIRPTPTAPQPILIEEAHRLWQQAIRRRLIGAKRPGQTLSGGLDSRVILAEAAHQAPRWTAISFGVERCDDVHYASQAADRAGCIWIRQPLYGGRNPDWLSLRTSYIRATDGLIQLGDFQHFESLYLQAQLLDVHLSGYIGDAVCGPTFSTCGSPDDVLRNMPFYGLEIGLSRDEAHHRVSELCESVGPASPQFALYESKLPQSTNRWSAGWRGWIRVRRPFVDYEFFDFFMGLPAQYRQDPPLYHHWLKDRYPEYFESIPNQKTGMPILTPRWRLQAERGRRYTYRKARSALARLGINLPPRVRSFTDDEKHWRSPGTAERIEGTILRPNSLALSAFDEKQLRALLANWREGANAPAQAIGALYVFEAYHADLPQCLRHARRNQSVTP